jgi:hypothetical protein
MGSLEGALINTARAGCALVPALQGLTQFRCEPLSCRAEVLQHQTCMAQAIGLRQEGANGNDLVAAQKELRPKAAFGVCRKN